MRDGDNSGDADGWVVPVPPDNSVMGDVERKSVVRWGKALEAWVKVQRRSTGSLLSFAVLSLRDDRPRWIAMEGVSAAYRN